MVIILCVVNISLRPLAASPAPTTWANGVWQIQPNREQTDPFQARDFHETVITTTPYSASTTTPFIPLSTDLSSQVTPVDNPTRVTSAADPFSQDTSAAPSISKPRHSEESECSKAVLLCCDSHNPDHFSSR